jgi:hypothetical protein
VPATASRDDPEVIKTVEEFEKAAIAQIDDEEYWDDLMERGKLLRLIETPFQAPIGDDLFGSIRKNNIGQVACCPIVLSWLCCHVCAVMGAGRGLVLYWCS